VLDEALRPKELATVSNGRNLGAKSCTSKEVHLPDLEQPPCKAWLNWLRKADDLLCTTQKQHKNERGSPTKASLQARLCKVTS